MIRANDEQAKNNFMAIQVEELKGKEERNQVKRSTRAQSPWDRMDCPFLSFALMPSWCRDM